MRASVTLFTYDIPKSSRTDRMVDSAPSYYQESEVYNWLQEVKAREFERIEQNNDDLQLQLNPQTATWALPYYEKAFKLIPATNATIEDRRSNIVSRMRGVGKFSAPLVKSVAESFTNGTVAVSIDVVNYLVTIKFVSNLGLPPKIDDLKAAIENILHAHLGITYQFRYLTITEVQAFTLTQLESTPLNNFAPFLENQA